MHGELPRQIWARTSARNRRYLAIALILILFAVPTVALAADAGNGPPSQNAVPAASLVPAGG